MHHPNPSEIHNSGFLYAKNPRDNQFIQFLMNLGYWKSVVLVTLVSIVGSVAVTVLYFGLFTPGVYTCSALSWAMTIITPAIIAPLISLAVMKLFFELEDARQLAFALSIHDGMTGIYNRRHFMEMAEAEFSKAVRYDLPLSLIMIDADHFKSINDNFGHKAGDEALQAITQSAKSCLRGGDLFARYGGEEFVLLMPQTGITGAKELAERIRAHIVRTGGL